MRRKKIPMSRALMYFTVGLVLSVIINLAFAQAVEAMEWVNANQATIAWNAATTNVSGEAIPDGDGIGYRVYTKRLPNGGNVVVGNTDQLQFTLTFAAEGKYVTGVSAVRIPSGETEEIESAITWSDSTDVAAVLVPFGIVYYERPSAPKGLSQ